MAIEWWLTTEKNVANDSATPDVTLGAIILVQNFWSNVVGGAELLIECLVRIIHKRCAEINDLDLVKFFVLFEQDVLRFKVSVTDMLISRKSYLCTMLF